MRNDKNFNSAMQYKQIPGLRRDLLILAGRLRESFKIDDGIESQGL